MNRTTQLQQALASRILILDGAMGTMIQRHKLEEADYRGTRFAAWHTDVKGNNDLLVLSQPQIIRGIHAQYPSIHIFGALSGLFELKCQPTAIL